MNPHLASDLTASRIQELRLAAGRRRELTCHAPPDRAASTRAGGERRPISSPLRRRLGFTLVSMGLRLLAG
jgi:hypothetical protein